MSVQAFDIEFAGNLSTLFVEKQALHVSCLEVCGNFLYVGCKEGLIIRCGFKKSAGIQAVVISKAVSSHSMNNMIVQMRAISALNQLLVLCDDMLSILDLECLTLVRSLKFKNVQSFCLNENPLSEDPFTVEICIGYKKKISYIYLGDENFKLIKEISTNATPSVLAMDGVHICFAVGLEYCMLNIQTGETQNLFHIDSPDQVPLIHRVSKGEFLLCGPGDLGMFVTTQGFSEKLPITFPSLVSALAYHHPYVLAVTEQGISFYSIIDQKSKQTIAISNVRCLVNGDGHVFASSSIDLFALLPISWEIQLEKLLGENRVEEALQLASNAHISSNSKERHQQLILQLEQRVALQHFASGRFSDAMELFETCKIDPLEVIEINSKKTFLDEVSRSTAELFFVDFLQRWRVKNLPSEQKKAVDTALLNYLVENDKDGAQLMDFLTKCNLTDPSVTRSLLLSRGKHHGLAVFLASSQDWEGAFELWDKLLKKELEDLHFPGYTYIVDQLIKSGNVSLIWRFSGEILKRDEAAGAKIFTDLFRSSTVSVKPSDIIEYLSKFHQSLKIFLEFLINEKKNTEALVHTQLATLYIDEVNRTDPQRNSPGSRLTINKLRSLLRTSPCLDLDRLAEILKTPRFPHEYAIACGRLGHHADAIKIFIDQLKDFDAAEEYCACIDDPKAWNCLLNSCMTECQGVNFDRMTDLLRRRPGQFDVPSALLSMPDGARFESIAAFVNFAVRESLHDKRMKMIEKSLHQMDNITNRQQLALLQKDSFILQPSSYCCVCKKRFNITEGLVRYPNGVLTHEKCAPNRHVCPLTGHLFKVDTP